MKLGCKRVTTKGLAAGVNRHWSDVTQQTPEVYRAGVRRELHPQAFHGDTGKDCRNIKQT